MKKEIYTCDGCGKQKGEVNHWYAVSLGTKTEACLVVTSLATSQEYEPVRGRIWEHFCGESCVLKMIARNLPK